MQRICITSTVGAGGTKLYLNNTAQGQRDRLESQIRMDQLTVGARHYNFGAPPQVTGFLEGEISELLIYSRILSDAERRQVDEYLVKKHGDKKRVTLPPSRNYGEKTGTSRQSAASPNVCARICCSAFAPATAQHQQRSLSPGR